MEEGKRQIEEKVGMKANKQTCVADGALVPVETQAAITRALAVQDLEHQRRCAQVHDTA